MYKILKRVRLYLSCCEQIRERGSAALSMTNFLKSLSPLERERAWGMYHLSTTDLSVKEEGRLLIFNDEDEVQLLATPGSSDPSQVENKSLYTMILDNPYNTSQWRTLTIFQNKEVTNFYVVHVFAITMLCIRDNIQLQAPLHHGGTGYTTWDGKLWLGP